MFRHELVRRGYRNMLFQCGSVFLAAAEVGTVQTDGPCMIFENRAPPWLACIPNEESIGSLFVLARHEEPMICRHTLG